MNKKISTVQKGFIVENRICELITLGSGGELTNYRPIADDDGIDIVVNLKGKIEPRFIQIKSRFILQKNGSFMQNVKVSAIRENPNLYFVFAYYNIEELNLECIWLVPSERFIQLAQRREFKEPNKNYFRFSANPRTSMGKWSKFKVDPRSLAKALYQNPMNH